MDNVIKVRFRSHARTSMSARKSSAVTRLSVADLTAEAKSLDNQDLPLRNRDMVERSHLTPVARMSEAIASSSKLSSSMNFDRCMDDIVHTMHGAVNGVCAPPALEPTGNRVHNAHVGRGIQKPKFQPPHKAPRSRTFLREYRKTVNLSQEEAAAALGYTNRSTLSKVEAGKVPYTQDLIEAAAVLYKTSIWHLLYCPPNTSLPEALKIWTKSVEPRR